MDKPFWKSLSIWAGALMVVAGALLSIESSAVNPLVLEGLAILGIRRAL